MSKKIKGSGWLWSAHGKHPAYKDYFTIGDDSPLSRAFFDWVDRGAQSVISKGDRGQVPHSFRFWAKGPAKGQLLCGLLRSSCDQLARPYPLMILGTGYLPDWEVHWNLLPLACEKIWEKLEYMAAKRYGSLGLFQGELKLLKSPDNNWSKLNLLPRYEEVEISGDERTCTEGVVVVALNNYPGIDFSGHILEHHHCLKGASVEIPKAVFAGGKAEQTRMYFYSSPLQAENYVQLWLS